MRAGSLTERVAVEEPLTTQDDTGEEITTWSPVASVWGAVEPLTGREKLQAGQVGATMDTRFRIRWTPAMERINAKWRLTHDEVIYNIVSVAQVGMARREIEIMATSGLNAG